MRRTNALKGTLESLSVVYNDGERVPVEFDKPSRAAPDGTVYVSPNVREALGRDLSGPQELRSIANTLSHEIEHIRESDLTSKKEFMDEYDDHRQFAGAVINILEDQYIDFRRTQRFPGLRKAQAFVVDAMMENHHRRPRVDNIDGPVRRLRETLTQVAFAGYAKGISEADDDLREFAGRVYPLIEEVRREHDQEARKDLAHAVMDVALEYLPEQQDVDLPDTCVVCEENPPVVIVPLLGPVCDECAPTGHGTGDGDGDGERDDDGGTIEIPDPPGGGGQPGPMGGDPDDGDGDDGGEAGAGRRFDEPDGDPDDGDADGEGQGGAGGEPGGDDEAGGEGGQGGAGGEGDADDPEGSDAGSAGYQRDDGDDDGREIDPREWDWLDLGDHEGHTVSIVDDDAEV